ncbi:MAG: hypothetical protein ACK4SI_06035 [Brevundimonas aurantiaca]|uniref:hypothetical protein n=1 Tax=Brevundimonas aurantiaca TaxID=74316 RepID=UPI00391B723B
MSVQTAEELKAIFFDAYDGFADKRLKDISRDAPFIVDDRNKSDFDARGQLFMWFCQMFVTVEASHRVRLSLRGGVPKSAGVTAWLREQRAEQTNFGTEFVITPENLKALDDLIIRFADITKKRYDTKAYKFVVPRVYKSLGVLKKVLEAAWA